jgi:ribosomal protein S12 methylthiotransferase
MFIVFKRGTFMIKVAVKTLGCDKNTVDSEKILGLLKENNFKIVYDINNTDILIINTCGFIQSAKEESINTILEYAKIKERYNFKIVVMGCLAQRYAYELYEEIHEIDAVLGLNYYENLSDLVNRIYQGNKIVKTKKLNSLKREKFGKRVLETPNHYSYLKISEGCNNYCSYCVIPMIKGIYRSTEMDELIKEAKYLVNKGVKEIILIAQDTSVYGYDLYGKIKLPELLMKLSEIKKLKWLRLLYCYPSNITDELIDVMANCEKICKYIDMPIQHADNEILKLMNRKHGVNEIESIIYKLRSRIPEITLRTTFIVGFPGEKNNNFNNLLSFIEKNKFDWAGFFKYSKEEGTYAAGLY